MIHRPILREVVLALEDIFAKGKYADKVLEQTFHRNRKLGSRDRRQIAELTYDSVRWWRKLVYLATGQDQIEFESSKAWTVIGLLLNEQGTSLPDWPEFEKFRQISTDIYHKRAATVQSDPALNQSYPDWLYRMAEDQIGKPWARWAQELNRQAPVVLRTNRLKIDRDRLQKELTQAGFQISKAPETSDGLLLLERKNIFSSELFQKGLFEVQDGASQHVAPLLEVEPGQRVIDACAGGGGKTLHLAALMKNKGRILALDIHEYKLQELSKRSRRAGIDIIETRPIDSTKTVKRLEASADRLLLDVPCSGLGVLRRNPDAKWKLKPERIRDLETLQQDLLTRYSKMLKPGGIMVYSTCSCLPSENEKQIETFLKANSEFKLKSEQRMEVGQNGYDGFYAAVLST